MTRVLVLFDFDGTLTTRDSLSDFILYSKGFIETLLGGIYLSPLLLGYGCKIISNDWAKQQVLRYFFGGCSLVEVEVIGQKYAKVRIPLILRNKGLDKIQWHVKQGHRVVIVSASVDLWLKGWVDEIGVELIATQLEVKEGFLTGAFRSKNCHGEEKVLRIKSYLNLNDYQTIYAYGDTSGDKPMLDLANYSEYRPFR